MTQPQTERRSRRTHKNSRDGCPNCRSNRMKCNEELPVCGHCNKKGLRCGYLDFPPEKLEHIRQKHANASDGSGYPKVASADMGRTYGGMAQTPPRVSFGADLRSHPEYVSSSMSGSVQKPSHHREAPKRRSNIMTTDVRSQVYSREFCWVTSQLDLAHTSKSPMDQLLETTQVGDFSSSQTYPELLANDFSTEGAGASNPSPSCLSNGIKVKARFRKLSVPANLKISFTPNQFLRKRSSLFSQGDLDPPVVSPIYSESDSRKYWLEVFSKATRFDLFFFYFIDKSLNILMRVSESVVSGDIITTPSDSSPETEGNFFSFFYNSRDLETLTQKSYVTYGKVIRELRKSIFSFSAEYPAKISLFSARACYMNPTADFKTCSLMMAGSLILSKNILENVETQEWAERNIRQELQMLNYFSSMSVCPDYNTDVILDLKDNFRKYRSFVQQMTTRPGGCHLEQGVEDVLRDSLYMHNCHELDKFFTKLETYYLPMIQACSDHFVQGDTSVRYFSPTLLFEIMYEWFKVYPGERMLMGTNMHPLKKIMFLFFHALGKAMNHVLSPIKAVLFVDPCNIMFTKVSMEFFEPGGCDHGVCSKLETALASVYRTIRYFDSRSMLYAYYMADASVLDQEFLRSVADHAPKSWPYKDIVQVLPNKLRGETQLTSFSTGYFRIEHFAFLAPMLGHSECGALISQELDRQSRALNEPYSFDFNLGLSNHDFNPDSIIDCYVAFRSDQLRKRGYPSPDRALARVQTLIQAYSEMDSAVKTATPTDLS